MDGCALRFVVCRAKDNLLKVADEILDAVRHANQIVVVTHVSPDGDAIGSLTAVGQALAQLELNFTLACDDDAPDKFVYLPLVGEMQRRIQEEHVALVMALDCGDEERMGNVYAKLPDPKPAIVNIDHHITNTRFGKINLVDAEATSTTEILARLLPEMGVEITAGIAQSLLTGLVTDTLGFRTNNVTAGTLQVASELMAAGASLADIMRDALVLKPLTTLKMWRAGLNGMQIEDGVAWAVLSLAEQRAISKERGITSHGLGNMMADVHGMAMSAVFSEKEDGRITVGFRGQPPFDVAELAASFGGGGHRYASGCSLQGALDVVVARVVSAAKRHIAEQKAALADG